MDIAESDAGSRANALSKQIIGACIEVHTRLGPGLLESAYEQCLCRELALSGIPFERQRAVPIDYKGVRLDCGYRLDLVVDGLVVVEAKAIDALLPIHQAQLMTYLKLSGLKLGLLINFNVSRLREGIKRVVLNFDDPATRARTVR